jgi:K+-sensing histidine kinase KdpD
VPDAQADEETYRREAAAAFAHDIRTPLTSARMVLDISRQASGDELTLDAELAGMLAASLAQLEQLADDFQDASRLERGRTRLSAGPTALDATVESARGILGRGVQLVADQLPEVSGPWDATRLARALAAFAEAANRCGDGSGAVGLDGQADEAAVHLAFRSGDAPTSPKSASSEAGYAFFPARIVIMAMGGDVTFERGERAARVGVRLPLR